MAGKTSTRSSTAGSGSSRASGGPSKASGSRTARTVTTPRKPTAPRKSTASRAGASGRSGPARRPARKKKSGGAFAVVGRGVSSAWSFTARGLGATTRTVGKAADIEHGHRRDGIALGLIAVSVVVVASIWFSAGGPVGEWIETGVRAVIGAAAYVAPIVAIAIAIVLMRSEPKPEIRPRLVLGSILLGLPVLGLWHMAAGSPSDGTGRADGGGFFGYVAGGPIADGLTVWLAVPLLLLAALFGLLLLTGTTVRDVPNRLRSLFGTDSRGDEYDEYDPADYGSEFGDDYDRDYDPSGFDADGYPVHGAYSPSRSGGGVLRARVFLTGTYSSVG